MKKSTMKTLGQCKFMHNYAPCCFKFCTCPICKDYFIVPRYEKSSRFMKEGYERDFLRYLQSLLAEVERRIRRGHARLALSQAQQNAGVRNLDW